MHRQVLGVAALLMLAGCTGTFEVEQTEPIRVQMEGGSEQTHMESGEEREFVVVMQETETARFDVEVRQTSDGPARVLVEIRDDDTDEVLESQTIRVDSSGGSDVTIENLIVNVGGKDNIVILAQALEGDVDVSVSAHEQTGDDVDVGTTDEGTTDEGASDDDDTGNVTVPPVDNATDNATVNTTG